MKLLIPPPFVALICAGLMWLAYSHFPEFTFHIPLQNELAILLVLIGVAIDIAAMRLFIRFKTTINPISPENASELVTDGIYRFTRNPMYLAMGLMLCAFGIWLGTLSTPIVLVVFWIYLNRFQIKPEEEILLDKFGEAYAEYCKVTPRWIWWGKG